MWHGRRDNPWGYMPGVQAHLLQREAFPTPKPAPSPIDPGTPAGVEDVAVGLPGEQRDAWTAFMRRQVLASKNQVAFAQLAFHTAREMGIKPEDRGPLIIRSVRAYTKERPPAMQILNIDQAHAELSKADARGGKYHKRVTTADGKHRYYYDEDDYREKHGDHVSGEDARKQYLSKQIHKTVCEKGKEGCEIEHLRPHVEKHGAKAVSQAIQSHGELAFDAKGKKLFRKSDLVVHYIDAIMDEAFNESGAPTAPDDAPQLDNGETFLITTGYEDHPPEGGEVRDLEWQVYGFAQP